MSVWLTAAAAVLALLLLRRRAPGRLSQLDVGGPVVGAGGSTAHSTATGPAGLVVLTAVAASAAAAAGVAVPVVALGAVGVVLVPALLRRHRRRQQEAARRVATVEVTVALAAELRAGRSGHQALVAAAQMPGALHDDLTAAVRAVAVGGSCASELASLAQTPGAQRLHAVSVTWSVAERSGGQVGVVLERLAAAMDDDEELRGELEAAMAGPRSTMVLLAGLPVIGLLLGQSIGASPLRFLLHSLAGQACLAVAVGLDLVGVWVTSAIARHALDG